MFLSCKGISLSTRDPSETLVMANICDVNHYDGIIMGVIASQMTSLAIVFSTVYLDTDQRKHQSSASLAFCVGNSPEAGEIPAQVASNAENVSIWWRHHVLIQARWDLMYGISMETSWQCVCKANWLHWLIQTEDRLQTACSICYIILSSSSL